MSKGISNTSRTLRYLREQGWEADKVEQFNPYAGKFGQRKDLFGIIDIIALSEHGITGVQSCGQAFNEHHDTIMESDNTVKWLSAGGALFLIGWRKVKLKRGGKAMRWSPRIRQYKVSEEVDVDSRAVDVIVDFIDQ